MQIRTIRTSVLVLALALVCPVAGFSRKPAAAAQEICAVCARAELGFLASDELHGRGSGTRDEHLAALYAAALLESFGLEPAFAPASPPGTGPDGEFGGYLQRAPLPNPLPERLAQRLKQHGFDQNQRSDTWNAMALLRGTGDGPAPEQPKEAILLTAHLDHLGLGEAVDGDQIYNGADDDASGTTAVLELARALSRGARPRRSILFVLFGSEELGGYGNRYFLEHPPLPLDRIVANLEFEMIGRPDPALKTRTLWLTGYERSNLGPVLAGHGAAISADPHPDEHFFQRSDNYALAKHGIVAQTVSSFGLHKDYHRPSDEVGKIDFDFLTHSIQSMVAPVRWLADSGFKPEWNPGGKP